MQILVAAADVYFIGLLGTDALAAIALVFPFQMLMQNIAMGGMGGGVASALARALGGGRVDDAQALVLHALILAVAFASAFALLAWTAAPRLYGLMGVPARRWRPPWPTATSGLRARSCCGPAPSRGP